jgi:hypothetical protein
MDLLPDLIPLEELLSDLQKQGQRLNKREQTEIAKDLTKEAKAMPDGIEMLREVSRIAETVLPLLAPILMLV